MPNIHDLKTVVPDPKTPTAARKWRPKNEPLIPTRSIQTVACNSEDLDTDHKQSLLETATKQTTSLETSLMKTTPIETSVIETTAIEIPPARAKNLNLAQEQTSLIETTLLETSLMKTTPIETSVIETTVASDIETTPPIDSECSSFATGLKYGGYMPLKCSLFAPETFTLLGPIEFKLFTYLTFLKWRYPEKTGYVRAALPYLARGTKIARSAVFNHLKTLITMKLITCIETNQKLGNLYEISDIALWTSSDDKKKPQENKQSLLETASTETASKQTTTVRKTDYNSPHNKLQQSVTETKDLSPLTFSTSLSLSQFLKPIQLTELETRWLSFMKKEREREEKGLLKLFTQKPEEAEIILKAFEIILKEQDEYGEIKSAISVLETNYTGQYRAKALAAIARLQEKQKQTHTAAEVKSKQTTDEDAEAQIQLIRMQCFEEAFPDLAIRKQYILNVCKDNPMFLKLGAGSPIATSYAVTQWAQGEGSAVVLSALDRETTQTQN